MMKEPLPMTALSMTVRDVVGLIAIVTGSIAAYFGAQASTDTRISTVSQNVALHEQRIDQQDKSNEEIKGDVKTLDNKLNALLLRQGINPAIYEEDK